MTPVVLASASPRRKALLEALGIPVEVSPSDVDEIGDGDPNAVAVYNARVKRDAVASEIPGPALVIAADTVVILDDHLMGKPRDLDEARDMIRALSGRTHAVITGVAVIDTETGRAAEGYERTEVTFRDLAQDEINGFIETVRPLDRAGGYTVDGPGSLLVESYNGCYQNVLGLPVVRLDKLCREIGQNLFALMDGSKASFL